MKTIALLGTPDDRSYLARLNEAVGAHSVKVSLQPEPYIAGIAAKIRSNKINAIICTCPTTLVTLLNTQIDFRHPLDKRGTKRKLALDDYAGSFFTIPAARLGTEEDVDVLILNPLRQLVTTPEGKFLFKRYITKITAPEKWFPQTRFTWEVWTPATGEELLRRFSNATLLAVDIETYRGDDLRRIHCVGYCALFADGSTHSVVVPFRDMLAHAFVRKLNAAPPPKVMQGGMYDNAYFLRWNVPVYNYLYDTLNLFHCWYSELPKRLDFISAFAVRRIRFWKDDSAGDEFNLFEYNARDCWATLTSWLSLLREVPDYALTNYLIEFPMVFPCLHTELDGLAVNKERFEKNKKLAEERLEAVAAPLRAWFGPDFNPRSSDQCKRLLKVLGMGNVESADAQAMIACASVHPLNERIISALLTYRKQAKLLSTYFVWEKFWHDRLHYESDPAGTDTLRFASSESNFWCGFQIQNIPQGPAVKDWIECDEGWDALAEGDYAQSEARCVGYMSGCKSLIAVVEGPHDYHSWNAHAFFGIPYTDIYEDETKITKNKPIRNLSKRVNHGSNYNMAEFMLLATMGPKAVAEARLLLKLPAKWALTQVCKYLLQTYAKTYPEIKKDWYDDIKRTIKLTKKLVSPLGWTRYFFSDPNSSKPALNAAVAHGPQNLSVSIINRVYYAIWRASVYGDLRDRVRLKAQIHDSIFFAYRGAEVPAIVQERMRDSIPVKGTDGVTRTMVIPVDMNAGSKTWGGLK